MRLSFFQTVSCAVWRLAGNVRGGEKKVVQVLESTRTMGPLSMHKINLKMFQFYDMDVCCFFLLSLFFSLMNRLCTHTANTVTSII